MRAIVSQRGRVDTLVPPNLITTHGAAVASTAGVSVSDGDEPALVELKGCPSCDGAGRATFFRAAQQNATKRQA